MTTIQKTNERRISQILNDIFIVVALMLFSGAFLAVIMQDTGSSFTRAEGNPTIRTVFLVIYVITFILGVRYIKKIATAVISNPLLILLLTLLFVSALWSAVPQVTIRRAMAMLGTTFFGYYFAIRYSLRKQLILLFWALILGLFLSLLLVLFFPQIGIMTARHGGNWQGAFAHKNSLGRIMALTIGLSLLLVAVEERRRWLFVATGIIAFIVLIFSNSVASILIALIILVLLMAMPIISIDLRLLGFATTGVLLIFLCGLLIVLFDVESAFAAIGRDQTLSGRFELWSAVGDLALKKPWFGYGFSGFWTGETGPPGRIVEVTSWNLPQHAHNGFLDLLVDVGFIGSFIFISLFVLTGLGAIIYAKSSGRRERYWPIFFLVYWILVNLAESAFLRPNHLFWLLFVSITVTVLSPMKISKRKADGQVSLITDV